MHDPNARPARQDAAALIQRGVDPAEIADITGLTPGQVARVARAVRVEAAIAAGTPPAQVATAEQVTMRTLQFDRALLRASSWAAQQRQTLDERRAEALARKARGEGTQAIADALHTSVRTVLRDIQLSAPPPQA